MNDKSNKYLMHYGVKGMRWGVVNEPQPEPKNPKPKKELTNNIEREYLLKQQLLDIEKQKIENEKIKNRQQYKIDRSKISADKTVSVNEAKQYAEVSNRKIMAAITATTILTNAAIKLASKILANKRSSEIVKR